MSGIDGKIAVITGGTQGLGAAIAKFFAEAGTASIAIVGRGLDKGQTKVKVNSMKTDELNAAVIEILKSEETGLNGGFGEIKVCPTPQLGGIQ